MYPNKKKQNVICTWMDYIIIFVPLLLIFCNFIFNFKATKSSVSLLQTNDLLSRIQLCVSQYGDHGTDGEHFGCRI